MDVSSLLHLVGRDGETFAKNIHVACRKGLPVRLPFSSTTVDNRMTPYVALCAVEMAGDIQEHPARTPVVDTDVTVSGGRKALWLADYIGRTWRLLERPCDVDTRDRALDFAAERADAHTPSNSV